MGGADRRPKRRVVLGVIAESVLGLGLVGCDRPESASLPFVGSLATDRAHVAPRARLLEATTPKPATRHGPFGRRAAADERDRDTWRRYKAHPPILTECREVGPAEVAPSD